MPGIAINDLFCSVGTGYVTSTTARLNEKSILCEKRHVSRRAPAISLASRVRQSDSNDHRFSIAFFLRRVAPYSRRTPPSSSCTRDSTRVYTSTRNESHVLPSFLLGERTGVRISSAWLKRFDRFKVNRIRCSVTEALFVEVRKCLSRMRPFVAYIGEKIVERYQREAAKRRKKVTNAKYAHLNISKSRLTFTSRISFDVSHHEKLFHLWIVRLWTVRTMNGEFLFCFLPQLPRVSSFFPLVLFTKNCTVARSECLCSGTIASRVTWPCWLKRRARQKIVY